ncbi:MAG: peptidylprolyl isomerase [Bdellovibrio sp.]|jgi:parvulin-like peptidyl-prolyl isomerase
MAAKSVSVLFSALVMFSGCIAFAQANKDQAVAVVGTKKITVEEFNRKFNEVRNMAVNPPTKSQFLEDLVRYELGVQEAERRNLEKDPIVQDRMKQELYKALLEKELADRVNKITVNDKEMEAYYKKNPEIRTSHILIELKPGATPEQKAEARKRASEIYEEVKKSKRPFEELVRLYSDDPLTKQTGGDVGYQSRVTLVPSYYDAILAMKVGEIRGLIDTPFGFHILKVTGRRSFDNSNKRQLRAAVFDEKRKGVFNEYFEKLKKSYKIQTNPGLIQ